MRRTRIRFLRVGALALIALAGCGMPEQRDTVGTVAQTSTLVPSGPHLYCIANVGHTMVAYSLEERRVLPETARFLDLDPVGPWFEGGMGYYLSRVESSGAGGNALIKFHPKTIVELDRLNFPANSNPNSMLALPSHPGLAWVALRGSTFDGFDTDGISVVDLASMADTAFCDLNADTKTCPRLVPDVGGLTSPLGFLWDDNCPAAAGGECAYAVINNFDPIAGVRDGWLLVLEPDAQGVPLLLDTVRLGRNPLLPMLLEPGGELWVVNNGGNVHFDPASGRPGTLQVLNTSLFANGIAGDETLAVLQLEDDATCQSVPRPDLGCDPTGIYGLDSGKAWVTTFPDDIVRTVDLTRDPLDLALEPWDEDLPRVTGPLFPTIKPASALFAALGGLGAARLGELNPLFNGLLSDQILQAGNGPLSCAEFDTP